MIRITARDFLSGAGNIAAAFDVILLEYRLPDALVEAGVLTIQEVPIAGAHATAR